MVSNLIKAGHFEEGVSQYGDRWIRLLLFLLVWRVQRTERSFTELTEAALKVNTRINFTLSFAPTLTTKLIFAFDNLGLVD